MPCVTTIYLTRQNADMTEGRGPMVHDRAFTTLREANKYIDQQPGCMGRRLKWSENRAGDWDVIEICVYDKAPDVTEELRQRALNKLTAEEKRLLGLTK